MSETKTNNEGCKPYKEKLEKTLYSIDYKTLSANGTEYPHNRIKVELVSYSSEMIVKGQKTEFTGEKIVITNSKLELQEGQVVLKSKISNGKIIEDKTQVKMTTKEFDDILKSFTKKSETKTESV